MSISNKEYNFEDLFKYKAYKRVLKTKDFNKAVKAVEFAEPGFDSEIYRKVTLDLTYEKESGIMYTVTIILKNEKTMKPK